MKEYRERNYRKRIKASDLVSFQVGVKETDLWVSAGDVLEEQTRDLILDARHEIESYIGSHPEFLATLNPYPYDPLAPPLVRQMIRASEQAGVGPMASVAGAIAQFVGAGLLGWTDQVIVENGGDIFLQVKRDVTVSIFAGLSPLSHKLGVLVPVRRMPAAVCSSSGTVGHSYSMGKADATCVLSSSAALADAAATSICNRVRGKKDLGLIAEWAEGIPGVLGCVIILGSAMAAWGEVELVEL